MVTEIGWNGPITHTGYDDYVMFDMISLAAEREHAARQVEERRELLHMRARLDAAERAAAQDDATFAAVARRVLRRK